MQTLPDVSPIDLNCPTADIGPPDLEMCDNDLAEVPNSEYLKLIVRRGSVSK